MQEQPILKMLLGAEAAPIYDREAMLREVLAAKLFEWLESKKFHVVDLKAMRSIVHDIQGHPEPDPFVETVPADIDRLNWMGFETLSAVNLAESISAALTFVGITSATGIDLLGEQGWEKLLQKVALLTNTRNAGPVRPDALPLQTGQSMAWAQLSLASLAREVFDGSFFNICLVDRLQAAMNDVRSSAGLSRPDHDKMVYAALRALHCKRWHEMPTEVSQGIKDAVWQTCGIDDQVGLIAFGQHWDSVRAHSVPTSTLSAAVTTAPGEDSPAAAGMSRNPSLFAALRNLIFGHSPLRSRRPTHND